MKSKRLYIRFLILLLLMAILGKGSYALPGNSGALTPLPLVIVAVDKLDSLEFFNCKLPSVKRLLATSACGLMNIRSGLGYTDTGSGYLTLGSGNRGTAPVMSGSTYNLGQPLPGGTADSYLNWTFGASKRAKSASDLVVPDIGLLKNQATMEDYFFDPGLLGATFHANGWRTCLLGNSDKWIVPGRPGGLLLMDRQGMIDEGNSDSNLNEEDPKFPYLNCFSVAKAALELKIRLDARKIIMVEFSDFARLDYYQDQMLPTYFLEEKQATWLKLDKLLEKIFKLRAANRFSLIVLAPSVSKESVKQKNLLAPLIINDAARGYQRGLLASGTTKWPGLVANIDFLPTVVKMAGIQTKTRFSGKVISVKQEKSARLQLINLNQRLIASNANQRRILDWFMGLISFGWIGGLLLTYFKKGFLGEWLINGVAVIPLTLIIMPLFPLWCWQLPGFLGITLILTIVFSRIKELDKRILILSGLIWGILICDQLLGWHLIRFSPLGYSAMAGSRYYGLGNEFMGVFLASALILAYLTCKRYTIKWPAPLILGITILIFCLPQLGAKFGGILVGAIGFPYYLIKFYNIKLYNKKLWGSVLAFFLILALIGWWDSLRPPEAQTHIGQFIRLVFNRDYEQLQLIIFRKIGMNLKLTMNSPWMRIILLALTLGIINKFVTRKSLVKPEDALLWRGLLVTGIAAYLFNDSGILAFATCLAYGFSVILLKMIRAFDDKKNDFNIAKNG